MKKALVVLVLVLMLVPAIGTAALASGAKERVSCLFYQTFAERDPSDCVA